MCIIAKKNMLRLIYSGLVNPLPDPNTLEEVDLLPPPLRRLPGKPKKVEEEKKMKIHRQIQEDDSPQSNVLTVEI